MKQPRLDALVYKRMYSIYKSEMIKRLGKKDYELKIQQDYQKMEMDMDRKIHLAPIHSKWSNYTKNNLIYEYSHPGIWVL